jgi:glycine cleavage system aminomethyltransferase T
LEEQRTPLSDLYIANGAHMAPLTKWDMPVQHAASIKTEHLAIMMAITKKKNIGRR